MGRWLPEEERQRRSHRIVELRDKHGLEFRVIAKRLGMCSSNCLRLYQREKAKEAAE